MSVTTRALADALMSIVGAAAVREHPGGELVGADGRAPQVAVRPRDLGEAARVVAFAHDEKLTVVPRGAGRAQTLGFVPGRVDVVLDLGDLDAIVEHNPEDMTATVQAGVTGGALAARLAAHRQALPLDPPGWGSRTMGGIAATAASGPLRTRYGTMRDLLLGVRFIQADGVLTWGGARVVKSVTGYDIPKLLVGSLGTLAVLGELTVRLHPLPEAEATSLVALANFDAAQELIARLVDSTLQPSRLELLDAAALVASSLPRAAAAIIVSFGSVEAAVRAQQAAVTAEASRMRTRPETMGPGFWRTYDRMLAETGTTRLAISTLSSRVGATATEAAAALAGTPGVVMTAAAALGVVRIAIGGGDTAALAAAIERLRGFVAGDGGSLVIERGPAALRARIDPWGSVPAPSLHLMRALKQEFDPERTLNPGRFVAGL
ncbi:MAG TPA: FAD-binding oxidoreductase [Methylomirabilota bacterium]|nr:FAD-binding oxidoreductase [Methylomirabilota bacterium]